MATEEYKSDEKHGRLVTISTARFYLPGYIRLTIRDEDGDEKQIYVPPREEGNVGPLLGQRVTYVLDDDIPKLVRTIRRASAASRAERDVMFG